MARSDRDDHPDLKGMVVRVAGRLLAERYFNGESPDALVILAASRHFAYAPFSLDPGRWMAASGELTG
jgi:hypothetical protein